ncbi:Fc receptor-like protein 5 [Pangasianodon hypophthalmus]|uniref:Fc receptor-like protein 5 n=1 Tax=Pangasianodon hypophthalmus TaxID=310915 RepID=UPI002307CA42|nr:Fc receptor-like protein 5 [Pangasianodon hypophthalmus]
MEHQSKPKPTVRVNPQSSVYTGETITLSCELQSAGWKFQWYKYNEQLQLLSTETVPKNKFRVTVGNAGETVYQCTAWRYNSWTDTYYYTENSDQVFSGDAVTLRCDIQDESVSSWQYSWYKDASHSPVSSEQVYRISGVEVTHTGKYTCRGAERGGSHSSYFKRPWAVLSVSPQSWLTEGDSVTLSCDVTDSSTDWTFSWYTAVPYRNGLTQIKHNHGYSMYVELLSDSSRGSGGSYTLSPAALKHTGVYMCRGERGEPAVHTQYSNPQPLWITGESPPVSLIISPSRTQHFTKDSLSLSCEDQSISTGWTVRRYTHSEGVLDCSRWGSVTGSTCKISFLSTSHTGVYWCESESGENSNPVNITVHGESSCSVFSVKGKMTISFRLYTSMSACLPMPILVILQLIQTNCVAPNLAAPHKKPAATPSSPHGDVILESPVHPMTEGHPLTLHCLYRSRNSSNLRADFYKDGSVLQTQTTGEMIIYNLSKSDEGFYHCKHPERGESLKSWLLVRASGPSRAEAPFSVFMLISSVVTASPYLLVTIILLVKCYRARAHTDEERIENAVIEE